MQGNLTTYVTFKEGKCDVSSNYSVFDEWGNKVGDFIPSDGGCFGMIAGVIIFVALVVLGFLAEAFLKVIEWWVNQITSNMKKGRIILVLIYLVPFFVGFCLFTFFLIGMAYEIYMHF